MVPPNFELIASALSARVSLMQNLKPKEPNMHHFQTLEELRQRLNSIEDDLKVMRDKVDSPVKNLIDERLARVIPLRYALWAIDKALE